MTRPGTRVNAAPETARPRRLVRGLATYSTPLKRSGSLSRRYVHEIVVGEPAPRSEIQDLARLAEGGVHSPTLGVLAHRVGAGRETREVIQPVDVRQNGSADRTAQVNAPARQERPVGFVPQLPGDPAGLARSRHRRNGAGRGRSRIRRWSRGRIRRWSRGRIRRWGRSRSRRRSRRRRGRRGRGRGRALIDILVRVLVGAPRTMGGVVTATLRDARHKRRHSQTESDE